MAGSSLLLLIDDITSILDDVATMSKVAAKNTAGVLGDDLTLNAQQVSDVKADRELPVVWAVAKGSLRNKAILVPSALAISAAVPWAIVPLLMAGGTFLCYEGFEKVTHSLLHRKVSDAGPSHGRPPAMDPAALEKTKIRGAVRTDFILSAEIIVISLGTVSEATFGTQVAVLSVIALVMTAGVYGLVAGIVRLDDAGIYLRQRQSAAARATGHAILRMAPWLMRALSVAGTVAMFLVGGGILVHGFPGAHQVTEFAHTLLADLPGLGGGIGIFVPLLVNGAAGIAAGALVTVVVMAVKRGMRILRQSSD
ncbi:DUF808 domain-containing protein [Cupriavidus sp. 30B13]|uniref:DUF808 domain-containing protein n=1 Tax=Cupriavidus sp. 30B13 TaxID=3384241 RepID=UPI003B8ED5DF